MKYWWVNHSQTYNAEVDGGYIWSPTKKKNGGLNQGYRNLTLVNVGDPIISYARTHIKAIGIVNSPFMHSVVPTDFGATGDQWSGNGDGYLVEIIWDKLEKPLKPKDHIEIIKALLPHKHSPIRQTGDGNQGIYLSEISKELFKTIIELIGVKDDFIISEIEDLSEIAEDEEEQKNIEQTIIPETEKVQLIKARVGQGKFRIAVASVEKGCRITRTTDRRFLIASHIKPWSKSSNHEKLDGNNGLLLSPHIDRLFDKGWISFTDIGDILIAKATPKELIEDWNLRITNVGSFNKKQQGFLAYHRAHIFRDNNKTLLLF